MATSSFTRCRGDAIVCRRSRRSWTARAQSPAAVAASTSVPRSAEGSAGGASSSSTRPPTRVKLWASATVSGMARTAWYTADSWAFSRRSAAAAAASSSTRVNAMASTGVPEGRTATTMP